ncbi:unknown [Ligilactobacillus ruminis CAG:367]|nr:unknown [Ligilactobacillus ruminis CAG:367]
MPSRILRCAFFTRPLVRRAFLCVISMTGRLRQHIATDFDKSRPECHQHHQQIQLEFQTFDLIASKFCPSCSLSFAIVINASNLTETRSGLMDSNLYLIVFFLDKKVKK